MAATVNIIALAETPPETRGPAPAVSGSHAGGWAQLRCLEPQSAAFLLLATPAETRGPAVAVSGSGAVGWTKLRSLGPQSAELLVVWLEIFMFDLKAFAKKTRIAYYWWRHPWEGCSAQNNLLCTLHLMYNLQPNLMSALYFTNTGVLHCTVLYCTVRRCTDCCCAISTQSQPEKEIYFRRPSREKSKIISCHLSF